MAEQQKQKNALVQLILFIALSIIACVVQMLICNYGDDLVLKINSEFGNKPAAVGTIFEQTTASLIAFLIGNTVAKLLSYFLNRKATFGARKNLAFSLTVYVIMCVLLIVAETAVGAPLAAWYVSKLGTAMSKVSFLASDIEGWCNILSIITYSCVDLIIVFIMNKFVIMNDNLFVKKSKKDDAVVVDAVEPVSETVEETEEAPAEETVEEEAKEEPVVEEVPVEEPAAEAVKEEEAPAEEPVVEEAPAEEEAPVEETVEEEVAPVEEAAEEEPVVEEAPVEEPAAEEVKEEEIPAEEPVAEEANEEVAPVKKEAPVKAAGKIDFDLGVDGYHFYILANNNQIMFESQGFASMDTLQNGLETFKKALETGVGSVYQDKNKNYRFIINKRYVGEGYKTRAQAQAAMESVKKFTANGKVLEYVENPEKKAAYDAAKKAMKKAPKDFDWEKALAVPAKTSGKFTITELEDRGFFFSLAANNGQILYTSRFYVSAESAADAIITFKKAAYLGNFFIDNDKFGNFRYILKGGNGSIVYYGESYSTKESAINSSESVKKFAASAKIVPFEANKDEE